MRFFVSQLSDITIAVSRSITADFSWVTSNAEFESFTWTPARSRLFRVARFSASPLRRAGLSITCVFTPRLCASITALISAGSENTNIFTRSDSCAPAISSRIGFVLQDTVLFRGTVRDNIAYGRPTATEAEIVEAAKLANADEFIAKMPDGYNTMVGERGLTLSGGQRQRIGIARAIIRNAPILILDEPTAALDTESEKLVMEALERLMKGRTVLTIAHRLSTIRDAHMIMVLKDGVVAEQGTHDELVARNGVYAELYRVQAGQAAAAPAH